MNNLLHKGVCVVVGLWLTGCNSLTTTSVETLKVALRGPAPVVTASYVESLGKPVLVANLNQSEALLVVAADNDGLTEWHGLAQALVTHNGRVVQSAGLPAGGDIAAPLLADDPFINDLRKLLAGHQVTRLVDLPKRYLTAVPQHARYTPGAMESVDMLGTSRSLLRIDEAISMPTLDFKATNTYWIDPETGKVLASTQHLAPQLPVMRLLEIRQPGAAR